MHNTQGCGPPRGRSPARTPSQQSLFPSRLYNHALQTLIVLSLEPDTMVLPSGEKATEVT